MTSSPPPLPHREPLPCGECKAPLPIEVTHASSADSLECTLCGALYRGTIWKDAPEAWLGNVRIRAPRPPASQ